jgi:catechol 2,3-dioxygenase-like lactoylglutathione lyase family enzyme
MKIKFQGLNHVCLVVKDLEVAKRFYCDVLGFQPHSRVSSWFRMTESATLHLVEIPEATVDSSVYHEIQHLALEVDDLRKVVRTLLDNQMAPFQMDFEGNTEPIRSGEQSLAFGIGTVFVRDADGNLIEFLKLGHGIYKE